MRLFTAITLPQDVVAALTRLIDQLRPAAPSHSSLFITFYTRQAPAR